MVAALAHHLGEVAVRVGRDVVVRGVSRHHHGSVAVFGHLRQGHSDRAVLTQMRCGIALLLEADERGCAGDCRSDGVGEIFRARDVTAVADAANRAVDAVTLEGELRQHVRFGHSPICRDVIDGQVSEFVCTSECFGFSGVGDSCRIELGDEGAVGAGPMQTCDGHEIHGSFRWSAELEHAAGYGPCRKHVPGPGERVGGARRVGE